MSEQSGSQKTVFISYSRRDEQWKDRLLTHLNQLESLYGEKLIELWHDGDIGAGETWREEIERALNAADVAILVVTANFLTSTFILKEEIPRLLKRQEEGCCIVPILVLPCLWQRFEWLARIQIYPRGAKPLAGKRSVQIEEDLTTIVSEVAGILDKAPIDAAKIDVSKPVDGSQADAQTQEVPADIKRNSDVVAASAQRAGDAVTAVTQMISDPAVSAAVEHFRHDFQATGEVIESVKNYKDLHDELHNLEFQCYANIITDSRLLAADEMAWENMIEHAATLEATVHQLQAIAAQAKLPSYEIQWIQSLHQAHQKLQEAIEVHDSKPVKSAILLLNRVLSVEPIKLNDRMGEKARALDLAPLETALQFVRSRLSRPNMNADKISQIEDGIEALEGLKNAVSSLIKEHDAWQVVEFELRRIEASLSHGLDELEFSWPALKDTAEPLYKAGAQRWAVALRTEAERLQSALDAPDDPNKARKIQAYFHRYRREAGEHFYRVDTDLRESCGKLGNVSEPLMLLLRMTEG